MSIEAFYDRLSARLVWDFVRGNPRILAQLAFLDDSVRRDARSILVIGCGSGHAAHHLATRVAPRARILALDLSEENLRVARRLFPHPHITYRRMDITRERLEGVWEAIVLPDVYEHIPRDNRRQLHEALAVALVAERGKVLLTCPTPAHQEGLRRQGSGLQPVDEDVTLADLTTMGGALGARLTYYAEVSVFHTNDYFHAMLERGARELRPIGPDDRLEMKRLRKRGAVPACAWRLVKRAAGKAMRLGRVARHLGLHTAIRALRRPAADELGGK